ncbi:GntR family transcriptional regulator [Bacillus thuringiensis serovar finitimus]|nr:GntR family transcriptional regulator [Bacillus thuringiensis serovar finitimus]
MYLVNGTIFELSQSIFHYDEAKLLNQINFK